MTRRMVWGIFAVLCFSLLSTPAAFGQAVYGRIFGTVTDPQGAAIVGAKVTVTSVGQGTKDEVQSNEAGNYTVTHLIPGKYNVRAEVPGFKAFEAKDIQVFADQATGVDIKIQVGAVTETVTVTADDIPLLKTDRADVSFTLTAKQVEEIPLISRNFTELQLISPGAQTFGWQHAAGENPQSSLQINVNGQHFSGTAFQLDGTDNRDPILGIIVINPNLDSVQELKVTTQNYDAEFGQASAAVITAQTKSGTNEIHGSAFWFRRNDLLQARNPFTQRDPAAGIPESLWNQFGGSIGAPILKDKLFIFGDYQGTREKIGTSVSTDVPTALVRNTCLVPAAPGLMCDLSEYNRPIYNPNTGDPVTGAGRTQFAGALIPHEPGNDLISPQALAILSLLPAPTAAGTTFNLQRGGSGGFNQDAFNIRGDYALSEKIRAFGRYSFADFDQIGRGVFDTPTVALGGRGLGFQGLGGQSLVRNHSVAAGFDYTLSPTWLMDFRFGYFKYGVNVLPNGVGTTPATDFGIPGLNLGDEFTSGMPFMKIENPGGEEIRLGYSLDANRCNCPLVQEEDQFQFVNNWIKILGNHQIKFGGDLRYARNLRVPSDNHRAGQLEFQDEGTSLAGAGGLGLATFLLGHVNFFNRYVSSVTNAGERQRRFFFYGQDTWRFSPKLTFNYGLRWEIYFPQSVTCDGCGGFLDLQTGEIRAAGIGPVSRDFDVENTFTNFAPRIGVAYKLTPKTVVRVGYGRSYDIGVFGSIFGHSVTQNLPILATQEEIGPNPTERIDTAFRLAMGPPAFNVAAVCNINSSTGRCPLSDTFQSFVQPEEMRLGVVDAWNATVQYQLTPTMTAEAAYVGNKGSHVFTSNGSGGAPDYNLNQSTNVGRRIVPDCDRIPFCNGPISGVGNPFGWTGSLRYHANDSSNHYNAFILRVDKRFTQGYQFSAHWTLSRNTDFIGDGYNFHRAQTFGVTEFNRKNLFVLTGLWEFPFGRGKRWGTDVSKAWDYVIGGWQVNTVTTWGSGLPFTYSYNDCRDDIDVGVCAIIRTGDIGEGGDRNRWFIPASGPLGRNDPNTDGDNNHCTNPPAMAGSSGPWQRPLCGEFGSFGRNQGRGPQIFDTNLSVFKNVVFTERFRGQFRFEVFNIFNKVNLGNPTSCVDCGGAGTINGLAPGAAMRRAQFAVRLAF